MGLLILLTLLLSGVLVWTAFRRHAMRSSSGRIPRRRRGQTHRAYIRQYERDTEATGRTEESTLIEGRAVVSTREEFQMHDARGVPWQRRVTVLRECGFQHSTGGDVRMVGACHVCQRLVCSTRGCAFSCWYCGQCTCRAHTRIDDANPKRIRVFCVGCKWKHFVATWFGGG